MDFNSLIIKAMEREFCEENCYSCENESKIRTILIGYIRLLERGGKPDFFGISFIDEYSYNLDNGIKRAELGIADKNLMIPIYDDLGIGKTFLNFCNRYIPAKKVSIQLMIITEILLKYEQKIVSLLSDNKEAKLCSKCCCKSVLDTDSVITGNYVKAP